MNESIEPESGFRILHFVSILSVTSTLRRKKKQKKQRNKQTPQLKCRKCHPNFLFSLVSFQSYYKILGYFRRNAKCLQQSVAVHPADVYHLKGRSGIKKGFMLLKVLKCSYFLLQHWYICFIDCKICHFLENFFFFSDCGCEKQHVRPIGTVFPFWSYCLHNYMCKFQLI